FVAGEILLEPLLLGRACAAAARYHRAVRVQRDDVPGADVEAVVAGAGVPRDAADHPEAVEVIEVVDRGRGVVLVVTGDRIGDVLEQAPGRVVASGKAC